MSNEIKYLAIKLEGPFQSWGFDSQFNRRNTSLMPTKSAIAGICCAACGFDRGGQDEQVFLNKFEDIKMTAIAIPRAIQQKLYNGKIIEKNLNVRRLQDFHTVQNTMKASGILDKNCVITHRQYLNDASFGVLLKGKYDILKRIAVALENPIWGIWFGRKNCIPSAPVFRGLCENKKAALKLLIRVDDLSGFTYQDEVDNFIDGEDSIPDQAVSFRSEQRVFSPRRIKTVRGLK